MVRGGHFVPDIAAAVGVHKATVFAWINRGLRTGKADEPYRLFRDGYIAARAESVISLEACVQRAGREDPDMALKILERLRPNRWSLHKNQLRRIEKLAQELEEALKREVGRGSSQET